MRKPIRVFYSQLSGRFYATRHYKIEPARLVIITGEKYDVTDDIGSAITENQITFKPKGTP